MLREFLKQTRVYWRKSVIAIGIKLLAVGATLLLHYFLAQHLGPEGLGIFFLAFSVWSILLTIAKKGLDRTLLKFIAAFHELKEFAKSSFAFRFANIQTFKYAGLLTVITVLTYFFREFGKEGFVELLSIMGLSFIPISISHNIGESLKAKGHTDSGLIIQSMLLPISTIVALVITSHFVAISKEIASMVHVCASILVLAVSVVLWLLKGIQNDVLLESVEKEIISEEIKKSSSPIFWTSLLQNFSLWMPILIMGIFIDEKEIGIFEIARKISTGLTFFLVAFNSILAPRISALFVSGKIEEIADLCRKFTLIIFLLTGPIIIILMVFPSSILEIFGAEFTVGSLQLQILVLGQFVHLLFGPLGFVLMMTGKEKELQNLSLVSILLSSLLGFVFIPVFGGIGAAIAASFFYVCKSVMQAVLVWRNFHFLTITIKI